MSAEFTTPVGRLVGGHPMVSHIVKDNKTNLPRQHADGSPMVEFYCAIAIAKAGEQHWNQTDWGAVVYNAGVADWPNGEAGAATFAWKIEDGDSTVPNTKGRKPCEREGWPGHWIIHAKTQFSFPCYNHGVYDPLKQIGQKEMIKGGDYVRAVINVKGNGPSQSPGVYMNPTMFELYRAGVAIVSANAPDPEAGFGSVAAALPANAQVDASVAATTTASGPATPGGPGNGPTAPATDFLKPGEQKKQAPDGVWTVDQLKSAGYTDQQIAVLPNVT